MTLPPVNFKQSEPGGFYGTPDIVDGSLLVQINGVQQTAPAGYKINPCHLLPPAMYVVGNKLYVGGSFTELPAISEPLPLSCTDVLGLFAPGTPVKFLGRDINDNCVEGPLVIPPQLAYNVLYGGAQVPSMMVGNVRTFNITAPAYKDYCELLSEAVGTPVAALPTDKIVVSRGTECVTVELQSLLTDVQIASLVPIAFDEDTATFSFTITETNGNQYTASYTIPGAAPETPLAVTLIDGDGNNITATNVTQSGTNQHNVTINLPDPCPVSTDPAIELCDGDEFIGCGGQKYKLPDYIKAPAIQSNVAAIAVDLDAICGGGGAAAPITYSHLQQGGYGAQAVTIPAVTNPPPFIGAVVTQAFNAGDIILFSFTHGPKLSFSATAVTTIQAISGSVVDWQRVTQDIDTTSTLMVTEVWAGKVTAAGIMEITSGWDTTVSFSNLGQGAWTLDKAVGVDAAAVSFIDSTIFDGVQMAMLSGGCGWETGPATVALPVGKTDTYWIVGARHVGLGGSNGLNVITGTKLSDVNSTNTEFTEAVNCNAFIGSAWSGSNTFTAEIQHNSCVTANGPDADKVTGISFSRAISVPGFEYITDAEYGVDITAPNVCGLGDWRVKGTLSSGFITGSLAAGSSYEFLFELDGVVVGSYTVSNTGATALTINQALPASVVQLMDTLAAGATSSLHVVKTSVNCAGHVSGTTMSVTPPKLLLEII